MLATARILRAWRRRIGFSQEHLAHVVGVAFSTVNRWENGHTRPSALAWRSLEELASQHGAPLTLTRDSAVAAVARGAAT